MRHRGTTGRGRARAGLTAALALAALCATGCGVRPTSVPVDAGAAPSRMPCAVTDQSDLPPARPGVPVRIYLVCASRLHTVERAVPLPGQGAADERVALAQALVGRLGTPPSDAQRRAGLSTDVPVGLTVEGPHTGDPEGTLRLGENPEDLPGSALAQIVCTLVEDGAADDGTAARQGRVALGGPGQTPVRDYPCDTVVKSTPGALPSGSARTSG